MAAAALVGWIGGCARAPAPRGLADTDAAVLIPAIKSQVNSPTPDLPALVGLLESDDPAVRLFAIEALRRLTGQTFGYVGFVDPAEQTAAIATWRSAVGSAPGDGPEVAEAAPTTAPHPQAVESAGDAAATRPSDTPPMSGGPTVGPISE
jgi:hypothetical protein